MDIIKKSTPPENRPEKTLVKEKYRDQEFVISFHPKSRKYGFTIGDKSSGGISDTREDAVKAAVYEIEKSLAPSQ